MTIRAVIFDLDGVITDTAEYHFQSWAKLAAEEDLPFNRAINDRLRGLTRSQSLRIVLDGRQVDEHRFRELLRRKNEYYHELLEELGTDDLLPGIAELLDDLKSAGIRMAVGSSSRNAHRVLETLGIAGRFEVIAGGGSVEHPKPAPDVFLHIADRLKLTPTECAVVEDSSAGVEAALRGGFWVVGVGPAERVGDAHDRVETTAALSAERLLSLNG